MNGLVISRRIGESFMIGDDVIVTIVGLNGGQIKVNIVAPQNVVVDRAEIREKRLAEQAAAKTA